MDQLYFVEYSSRNMPSVKCLSFLTSDPLAANVLRIDIINKLEHVIFKLHLDFFVFEFLKV